MLMIKAKLANSQGAMCQSMFYILLFILLIILYVFFSLVCDCALVLCDTWNRSDDNDTISGIAILDTTAIPEMCYSISMFFRNQSPVSYTSNHWKVSMNVCLYSDKAIVCCVYCMKCSPESVNITRSQAVASIADRIASQQTVCSVGWGHGER